MKTKIVYVIHKNSKPLWDEVYASKQAATKRVEQLSAEKGNTFVYYDYNLNQLVAQRKKNHFLIGEITVKLGSLNEN